MPTKPDKTVFWFDDGKRPNVADELEKEKDITLHRLAYNGPKADIWGAMSASHVYCITSTRQEQPEEFRANAALLARCPEYLPSGWRLAERLDQSPTVAFEFAPEPEHVKDEFSQHLPLGCTLDRHGFPLSREHVLIPGPDFPNHELRRPFVWEVSLSGHNSSPMPRKDLAKSFHPSHQPGGIELTVHDEGGILAESRLKIRLELGQVSRLLKQLTEKSKNPIPGLGSRKERSVCRSLLR